MYITITFSQWHTKEKKKTFCNTSNQRVLPISHSDTFFFLFKIIFMIPNFYRIQFFFLFFFFSILICNQEKWHRFVLHINKNLLSVDEMDIDKMSRIDLLRNKCYERNFCIIFFLFFFFKIYLLYPSKHFNIF